MQALVTVFAPTANETDKTYKTSCRTNRTFLEGVFENLPLGICPVVVGFRGDPMKVAGSEWAGRPWRGDEEECWETTAAMNNYFSLAVFRPDEAGRYRRRKSNFHSLYAVMLDDVGTKVPSERLTLPPSWLIETSPGNHQAGYLLREPLVDGVIADRVMDAIVAAGLCDPGANGPRARLARLPVGVNGKQTPLFSCRLTEWAPHLRYSIEELIDGLQLDMKPPGRPKRNSSRHPQVGPLDGDPVLIPGPEENAVLAALRHNGLYKTPLG